MWKALTVFGPRVEDEVVAKILRYTTRGFSKRIGGKRTEKMETSSLSLEVKGRDGLQDIKASRIARPRKPAV